MAVIIPPMKFEHDNAHTLSFLEICKRARIMWKFI